MAHIIAINLASSPAGNPVSQTLGVILPNPFRQTSSSPIHPHQFLLLFPS
jgi:hypothetical protein